MKFVKEDYRAEQRKKLTLITISGIALIGLFIIWHSYSQRSAADKELAKVTGEGTTHPATAEKKESQTQVTQRKA